MIFVATLWRHLFNKSVHNGNKAKIKFHTTQYIQWHRGILRILTSDHIKDLTLHAKLLFDKTTHINMVNRNYKIDSLKTERTLLLFIFFGHWKLIKPSLHATIQYLKRKLLIPNKKFTTKEVWCLFITPFSLQFMCKLTTINELRLFQISM